MTICDRSHIRQLAAQRTAYDAAAAAFAAGVTEHNAVIDQFRRDCRAGDPEAVAEFRTLVLDSSAYPEGFPHQTRTVGTRQNRKFRSNYVIDAGGSVSAAMHAVSRRRI